MVSFTGVILNSEVDSNGAKMSPNALNQIAKQLRNKPIGFEFNPSIPPVYGVVHSAVLERGNVIATAEIDRPAHEVRAYLVPSFIVNKSHQEGATRVLDDVTLLEMSLTTQPADTHLTPINWDN